jgi:hypothetical protein
VSIRLPMHIDFLYHFTHARIVRGSDHLLLSKAPRALNVADCLLLQLSVPAASTLLMRFLTQRASRRFSVPILLHFAVHKEMYQLPPEAVFSAINFTTSSSRAAIPWTFLPTS